MSRTRIKIYGSIKIKSLTLVASSVIFVCSAMNRMQKHDLCMAGGQDECRNPGLRSKIELLLQSVVNSVTDTSSDIRLCAAPCIWQLPPSPSLRKETGKYWDRVKQTNKQKLSSFPDLKIYIIIQCVCVCTRTLAFSCVVYHYCCFFWWTNLTEIIFLINNGHAYMNGSDFSFQLKSGYGWHIFWAVAIKRTRLPTPFLKPRMAENL